MRYIRVTLGCTSLGHILATRHARVGSLLVGERRYRSYRHDRSYTLSSVLLVQEAGEITSVA
jgi:hypothetical protein